MLRRRDFAILSAGRLMSLQHIGSENANRKRPWRHLVLGVAPSGQLLLRVHRPVWQEKVLM